MKDLLLVYITCESEDQAKDIGVHLMNKKLCACVNIFPNIIPMFFWPPKSGKIDKTTEDKYKQLEKEVHKIHTYEVPCVIAIPVAHVSKNITIG